MFALILPFCLCLSIRDGVSLSEEAESHSRNIASEGVNCTTHRTLNSPEIVRLRQPRTGPQRSMPHVRVPPGH